MTETKTSKKKKKERKEYKGTAMQICKNPDTNRRSSMNFFQCAEKRFFKPVLVYKREERTIDAFYKLV